MSWQHHLTMVLTTLIVGGILAQALRKAPKFEADSGTATLRYGAWIEWLLGGCALFTCGGLAAAIFVPESRGAGLLLILMFGSGTVFLIGERRTLVRVGPHGVEASTSWRGKRSLSWSDIVRVDFSLLWGAFVLRGRDGTKIRVSAYLTGIGTLRSLLLETLPREIVSKAVERYDSARKAQS